MSVLLRFVSTLLSVYMLLIFFRIIVTWFQGPFLSGPLSFVARVTDPYLDLFRRFRFMRTSRIDFSPLAAIMVLVVVSNVVDLVSAYGRITFGLVLAIVLSALWSAVSFFLMFFLILTVVRLVSTIIGVNSTAPFWMTLDHILEPAAYKVSSMVARGKSLTYQNGLIISGVALFAVWLGGGALIRLLISLVGRPPF